MFRLLTVLLLVGVAHSRIVRRDADEVIAEITSKSEEFKKVIDDVQSEVDEVVKKFQDDTKPVLDDFKNKLNSNIGYLEDKFLEITNIDLVNETCGAVSIRENVETTYNVAHDCAQDAIKHVTREIRDALSSMSKLYQQLLEIRNTIIACIKSHDSDAYKQECIEGSKNRVSKVLAKFADALDSVKNLIAQSVKQTINFDVCLVLQGKESVMNKVREVVSCLKEKYPEIALVTDQIDQATEFFQNSVVNTLLSFKNDIVSRIIDVQSELANITRDFRASLSNIGSALTGLLKSTVTMLEEAGQSLAKKIKEVVCKLCLFSWLCPYC